MKGIRQDREKYEETELDRKDKKEESEMMPKRTGIKKDGEIEKNKGKHDDRSLRDRRGEKERKRRGWCIKSKEGKEGFKTEIGIIKLMESMKEENTEKREGNKRRGAASEETERRRNTKRNRGPEQGKNGIERDGRVVGGKINKKNRERNKKEADNEGKWRDRGNGR